MQYSNDVNIANLFVRVSIYILLYHLKQLGRLCISIYNFKVISPFIEAKMLKYDIHALCFAFDVSIYVVLILSILLFFRMMYENFE